MQTGSIKILFQQVWYLPGVASQRRNLCSGASSTVDIVLKFLSSTSQPCKLESLGQALSSHKPEGNWLSFLKQHDHIFDIHHLGLSGKSHKYTVSVKNGINSSNQTFSQANEHDFGVKDKTSFTTRATEYELIDDLSALDRIIASDPALEPKHGDKERCFVAVDCEGVSENLHLLQLATESGTYIIDCKLLGPKTVCQKLQPFLTSSHNIKVLHDLREDAKAIYNLGGVQLDGVLDTQLVASLLWDSSYSMGFNDFLLRMKLPTHPSKELLKQTRDDTSPWIQRPIQPDYLEYAALDVILLRNAIKPITQKFLKKEQLTRLMSLSKDRSDQANNILAVKVAVDREHVLESIGAKDFSSKVMSTESELYPFVHNLFKGQSTSDSALAVIDFQFGVSGLETIVIVSNKSRVSIECNPASINSTLDPLQPIWKSDTLIKMIHDVRKVRDTLKQSSIDLNNYLDIQLLGEVIFQEPFLSRESLQSSLFIRHLGTSTLQKDQEHFFAALIKMEIDKIPNRQAVVKAVLQASCLRAIDHGKNQICFDKTDTFRMHSAALFQSLEKNRAEDAFCGTKLVEHTDIDEVLRILPLELESRIRKVKCNSITEIVLDIGRRPHYWIENRRVFFRNETSFVVMQSDVDDIVNHLGEFGSDNRAGLSGQLHRFSAIRDRKGSITGLTIRIGRHIDGNADMLMDLIKGTGKSILILGEPGSGKTTIIREIIRKIANESNVMVVDTSNEIGGDGMIQHSCLGEARRMMVKSLTDQGDVMVECVQNHTPHVMVIDEIGRNKEVNAARTVKQRGVRIIASAHGDLRSLVGNPDLVGLVGGVNQVILGDEMAKARAKKQKGSDEELDFEFSKLKNQRAGPPTFDIVVEIHRGNCHQWRVVTHTASAVDKILVGSPYEAQLRTRNPETGEMTMERITA